MITDRTSQTSISEPVEIKPYEPLPAHQAYRQAGRIHLLTGVCLILACLGATWFAYQCFLVPQPKDFAPNWQHAQWVQAADENAPVAYFRYATNLNVQPDSAFLTVAASQVFNLYVNGSFIGSNQIDFLHGDYPHTYMYDITSALGVGVNVIALRVANLDKQTPSVRVSFGITQGKFTYYYGTGDGWQATALSTAVYPRYAASIKTWTSKGFDASSWPPIRKVTTPPASPMLAVNPLVYEQPVATHWISAGSQHQAYFVRQVQLPVGITGAWLRVVATGTANVFINGNLFMIWHAQPPIVRQNVVGYLSDNQTAVQYRTGLGLGVYDISSYLHPGINTLAIYVTTPGASAAQVGLDNLTAAMSVDMLITNLQGQNAWLASDTGWRVSAQPVDGWTQGSYAALSWPLPTSVGRPGASSIFYLSDSTIRNTQLIPFSLLCQVILYSIGAVLGLWLLMSLFQVRYRNRSPVDAFETMSLAYLPAVAFEAMLVVLSREPQIPRPFPYTWFWGLVLVLLVGAGYTLLWRNTGETRKQRYTTISDSAKRASDVLETPSSRDSLDSSRTVSSSQRPGKSHLEDRILAWFRAHWALIPLILLVVPLICYNLPYEPYWQDELTSYFAAKGILAYGLPFMPSGFLYAKGELYSYMLALSMLIFGDQGGTPRILSVAEYLVSLPLLYGIGCYFFNRRVALLATAMLALSPYALIWGRQVRMYEQAQVLTLLVMYMFYKAWQERKRVRLVYLAVACLVAMYLSHEETFIVLPAVVLCVLIISREATHRLPAVLYQKHWWFAAAIGSSIIVLQLLIVYFSHPPILGTDQSQRPLVQFTTENIPYYIKLMFFPMALNNSLPWISLNSLLAVLGCGLAMRRTDMRAKYCAVFLLVSFLTLTLAFTLESERYIYPLLPVYYLMGGYALLLSLRTMWRFARVRIVPHHLMQTAVSGPEGYLSRPMRVMVVFAASLICAGVLIFPTLPISSYDLFISQQAGFSYHRHYPDYDVVGQYMQQHWRKGDIVISVSPGISILYYVGHVDYFLSLDRALYLFEQDGRITDTPTGSITALLNQQDFVSVLATHTRVWIISDNGRYQEAAAKRFVIPPDFHIVYEGFGSAIYFRGG